MSTATGSGLARWAPGLAVLLGYRREWWRGDLLAGLTVAAYLVPQMMAYAEIAGLSPVTGLWAVIAPMCVYALLGSSRKLSVGPESTTALMTAVGVSALAGATTAQRHAEVAALLALVVGLVCLAGWAARLGFLANLLSRPVLVGYMAGIAVLMIASQLSRLSGVAVTGDTVWQELWSAFGQVADWHLPTVATASVVTVGLFWLRRRWPRLPGPLLMVLLAAALVAWTPLGATGIALVGEIPSGLPALVFPDPTGIDPLHLLSVSVGIAVVGYSDVILTGRAFADHRAERIDATGELLAMGAANLANGLASGFPVSSSASRTVLGDAAGSRTQLHSLVAVLAVVATIVAFGPVLAVFPEAALAGMVVYAGLRLIDLTQFRRLAAFRTSEFVLALITLAAVLVLGLLPGIAVAIGLSLLDLIRRIAHPHDGVLGYVPGLAGMHDVEDYPESSQVAGLVVYRYDSPLFFANADDFLTRALAAVDEAPSGTSWFLLNAEANIEVDLTAVDALDQLRIRLRQDGIQLAIARLKWEVRQQLDVAGFIEALGDNRVYATLPVAVAAYEQWYRETRGQDPGPPSGGRP